MSAKEEATQKTDVEEIVYFGNLTLVQKEKRHIKVQKFYGFLEYDWGSEKAGTESDWKTGAKEWQIYKEVHGWQEKNDQQRQYMKRKFYTENIDKDFEKTMMYKSDDDRTNFMEYCQLYNSLGELGFSTLSEKSS